MHLATIIWNDTEEEPVLASGHKPLLGTAMIEIYHLAIDFKDDGLVSLEQLAA